MWTASVSIGSCDRSGKTGQCRRLMRWERATGRCLVRHVISLGGRCRRSCKCRYATRHHSCLEFAFVRLSRACLGKLTVFQLEFHACKAIGKLDDVTLSPGLLLQVGLVSNNWGGTTIQTWMSPSATKMCQPPPRESISFSAASNSPAAPQVVAHDHNLLRSRLGSRPMPSEPSVLWNTMVAPWTQQVEQTHIDIFRAILYEN